MHVQIVEFRLQDMAPETYAAMCDQLAPAFRDVPGLRSKIWLADAADNRFGGVYVWDNLMWMKEFAATDLSRAVITHPNLAEITSRDFAVLDAPTEVTRGVLATAVVVRSRSMPAKPEEVGDQPSRFTLLPFQQLPEESLRSASISPLLDQEVLDVSEAQAEPVVPPHGVTDDLRRKTMSVVAPRAVVHQRTLPGGSLT